MTTPIVHGENGLMTTENNQPPPTFVLVPRQGSPQLEASGGTNLLNNTRPPTRSNSISSDQSTESSSDNEQGSNPTCAIGSDLYNHLVSGNKDGISAVTTDLWEFESTEGKNSVLHIAASAGQAELITDILPRCKDAFKRKNKKGDLAFHSAAKAGELNALKALTDWRNYDNKVEIGKEILRKKNNKGNTALHIAVRNNQKEMAHHLVDQYGQACYHLNAEGVSPLYLAIRSGYSELAEKMLSIKHDKSAAEKPLLQGKSVAHAAIEAKNIGILGKILSSHEYLVESYDDKGCTSLSNAAFIGNLEGVLYLLENFPNCAFKCDKDGSFPIHKAASAGQIEVFKKLCHSHRLLNRQGQNILHVAAKSGKSKLVSVLLKVQELQRFINLKDENGNTPLHLAAKGFKPRVVVVLTRDERVNLELQNNQGLTALDLVEIYGGSSSSAFEERLTWLALRYVNAPRSSQATRKSVARNEKLQNEGEENEEIKSGKLTKKSILQEELENFKSRINTLLLVATLVATVTYAAGFTLPGGYNQSDPIGMATLAHKLAFKVFMISNTAAVYSSILSVVTLIWGQVGELKLSVVSLRLALPILGFALSMMSVAFMMGIFVVLKKMPWLSYAVLGFGSVSIIVVLVLFIPLYNPPYIRNPIARFFFSGPLFLLILVSEKCEVKYD